MTWTTKAAATLVAVGAVALGASWPRGARSGVGVEVAGAAGQAALSGSHLRELSGREVSLASLRGRPVVVNFWATWCPPCRFEIPELAAFYRAHRGECVEVLGVAEDSGGAGEVAAGAKELGIPYRVVLDPGAALARRFGISGLPHTVVLDGTGQVRRVFLGAIDRRQLEDALAPLLGATPRCES